MNIEKFKDISKDCKDMSFRQIWDTYDTQFNKLREAINSLGDKVVIESFTGEKVLTLSHTYQKNHCIVYLNNVIQWKDTDYEETDTTTITMLQDINSEDEIKVIIIINDDYNGGSSSGTTPGAGVVELTSQEYEALSQDEKEADILYIITDLD